MVRIRISLVLGLVACAGFAAVTPGYVHEQVQRYGARVAMRDLYSEQATWRHLVAGVRSGDPAWLRAAVSLWPGADAGAGSELRDALRRALIPAPAAVLDQIGPVLGFSDICSAPSDPPPSRAEALAELDAQILSVAHSQHPSARQCLVLLESSREGLDRFFSS